MEIASNRRLHPADDPNVIPMTKEEYAAAFPWAENARRLLLESRDQAHGVELLIAAGIDEETAEHLAAHHCGTFRGDIIEIPLSIAEPAPIA